MKATIFVTLKNGVLDPQGEAIVKSLQHLGHNNVSSVKQGKYFEVEIDTDNKEEAQNKAKDICEEMLANTVIENYQIEIA